MRQVEIENEKEGMRTRMYAEDDRMKNETDSIAELTLIRWDNFENGERK